MIEKIKNWCIGDLLQHAENEREAQRILLLYHSALYYFFFILLLGVILELLLTRFEDTTKVILSASSSLCCLGTLYVLKKSASLGKAAMVFITGNFIAATASVYIYHGGKIDITSGIWFIILYLFTNLIIGNRAGLVFLVVTFLQICVIMIIGYFELIQLEITYSNEEYFRDTPFVIGIAFFFLHYLTNQYIKSQKTLEHTLSSALQNAEALNQHLAANEEDLLAANDYQEEIIRKLAESEENLKIAQETAKIGSWDVDLVNHTIFWSEETYRIHDVPMDYVPTVTSAIDFYDEASKSIITEHFTKAIEEGQPFDLVLRIISGKSVPKWVRAVGKIREEDSKITNIYGVFQDITEDKENELALDHYRKGLESLNRIAAKGNISWKKQLKEALHVVGTYLNLPLGIISKISDNTYTIEHIHSVYKSYLQAEGHVFDLSNTYCSLIYQNNTAIAIPNIQVSKYKNHPFYHSMGLEAYIGAPIWVNGEKYGTVNFTSPYPKEEDFTQNDLNFIQLLANWIGSVLERSINEKKILEAKDAAEKASLAKAEFLSTMSHEIRTPMNAVIGMTHLLLQDEPRADQIENLHALKFSGENLLALINDILDFSKIEAGGIEFESTPFSIHDMARSIKQAMAFKVEEKGIALKVVLDNALPETVIGDPARLSQILNNLVSNAVKFTLQGHVEIKVQVINKTKDSVDLYFSVSDTGIGINTENIDKIFDSFSQASSDVTRKFGGTGLGLTITKRLLELQGSHIQVESQSGKGTKFYFTLGFKIGQPSESRGNRWQINAETGQGSLQGVRILLAEDNAMNVLVASKFLNKWGVDLKVAENGKIAVKKVKESVFDLVLMDLQMPGMDGYQACIEIKKNNPDLPIIALTASATTETQEKVFRAGMSDFITKPFNPNELFQVIAKNYRHRDTLISDR